MNGNMAVLSHENRRMRGKTSHISVYRSVRSTRQPSLDSLDNFTYKLSNLSVRIHLPTEISVDYSNNGGIGGKTSHISVHRGVRSTKQPPMNSLCNFT